MLKPAIALLAAILQSITVLSIPASADSNRPCDSADVSGVLTDLFRNPVTNLRRTPSETMSRGKWTTSIRTGWHRLIKKFHSEFFRPINEPKSVKVSSIMNTEKDMLKMLKAMGVETKHTDVITALRGNVEFWGKTKIIEDVKIPDGLELPTYGTIYEITRLPKARRTKSSGTTALLHPQMTESLRKLEQMDIKLVIDTSLPHTGASAYFWSYTGVIAIRPDTPWVVFMHEFQHAEFNSYIAPVFNRLVQNSITRTDSRALIDSSIPPERVKRLEQLIAKGLPELAVNETLSVDVELKLLGARRFIPMVGTDAEKYALRHQITELAKIKVDGGRLTSVQKRTLQKAKLRYAALLGIDYGGGAMAVVAPSAAVAIATSDTRDRAAKQNESNSLSKTEAIQAKKQFQLIIDNPQYDPYSYREYIYTPDGIVMGKMSDGTWIRLGK